MMLILAMWGCVHSPAEPLPTVELVPPTLQYNRVTCDGSGGRWSIDAETNSWAGNMRLYLTTNGQYVENHGITSISFDEDGTLETFESSLSIVKDWREANPGVSTAFLCDDPVVALFVIEDTEKNVSDCVYWPDSKVAYPELEETFNGHCLDLQRR